MDKMRWARRLTALIAVAAILTMTGIEESVSDTEAQSCAYTRSPARTSDIRVQRMQIPNWTTDVANEFALDGPYVGSVRIAGKAGTGVGDNPGFQCGTGGNTLTVTKNESQSFWVKRCGADEDVGFSVTLLVECRDPGESAAQTTMTFKDRAGGHIHSTGRLTAPELDGEGPIEQLHEDARHEPPQPRLSVTTSPAGAQHPLGTVVTLRWDSHCSQIEVLRNGVNIKTSGHNSHQEAWTRDSTITYAVQEHCDGDDADLTKTSEITWGDPDANSPAALIRLTAEPNTAQMGEPILISWEVAGAAHEAIECSRDGELVSGGQEARSDQQGTYRFWSSRPGQVTCTLTAEWVYDGDAPAMALSASEAEVETGDTITITWGLLNATDPDEIWITEDNRRLESPPGTLNVSHQSPGLRTYIARAQGSFGTVHEIIQLVWTEPPPATDDEVLTFQTIGELVAYRPTLPSAIPTVTGTDGVAYARLEGHIPMTAAWWARTVWVTPNMADQLAILHGKLEAARTREELREIANAYEDWSSRGGESVVQDLSGEALGNTITDLAASVRTRAASLPPEPPHIDKFTISDATTAANDNSIARGRSLMYDALAAATTASEFRTVASGIRAISTRLQTAPSDWLAVNGPPGRSQMRADADAADAQAEQWSEREELLNEVWSHMNQPATDSVAALTAMSTAPTGSLEIIVRDGDRLIRTITLAEYIRLRALPAVEDALAP